MGGYVENCKGIICTSAGIPIIDVSKSHDHFIFIMYLERWSSYWNGTVEAISIYRCSFTIGINILIVKIRWCPGNLIFIVEILYLKRCSFNVSIITVHSKNNALIHNLSVSPVLSFVVIVHDFCPYPSGLIHSHQGSHVILPVPMKQPWRIWVNKSHKSTKHVIETKRNKAQQNWVHFFYLLYIGDSGVNIMLFMGHCLLLIASLRWVLCQNF